MRRDIEVVCDEKGCHNSVEEDICETCLEKKLDESQETGDKEGYDRGHEEGYNEAKAEFAPEVVALENLSK